MAVERRSRSSSKNRRKSGHGSTHNIRRFPKHNSQQAKEYEILFLRKLHVHKEVSTHANKNIRDQQLKGDTTNTTLTKATSLAAETLKNTIVAAPKVISQIDKYILNKHYLVIVSPSYLRRLRNYVDDQGRQCSFELTHEEVQRHGGDVQKAATEKYRAIMENNSNGRAYCRRPAHLHTNQGRNAKASIVHDDALARNTHSFDYSYYQGAAVGSPTEWFWIVLHPISMMEDTTAITSITQELVGISSSNSMPLIGMRRVNSVLSSVYSESGYVADFDITCQERVFEERSVVRHMRSSMLPTHLYQPAGFAWVHSDSDSSNEANIFFAFSSGENSNCEQDYTVVVLRKQKRKTKKARNALRKDIFQV